MSLPLEGPPPAGYRRGDSTNYTTHHATVPVARRRSSVRLDAVFDRGADTDHAASLDAARTPNERIADVLNESIPGYARRPRARFGPRVSFAPPTVRYGAHFRGARDDWYGLKAVLTTGEG